MMYTRNTGRLPRNSSARYSPPPGYHGSAFSDHTADGEGLKHHLPNETIGGTPENLLSDNEQPMHRPTDGERGESGIRGKSAPDDESLVDCRGADRAKQTENAVRTQFPQPMRELLESLRGQIGTEELLILMVMLLVSSDGICAEVLILGLCLLGGMSG